MCVCMLQPAGVDYYENTTFRPTVRHINDDEAPKALEMEQDDVIEVYQVQ